MSKATPGNIDFINFRCKGTLLLLASGSIDPILTIFDKRAHCVNHRHCGKHVWYISNRISFDSTHFYSVWRRVRETCRKKFD